MYCTFKSRTSIITFARTISYCTLFEKDTSLQKLIKYFIFRTAKQGNIRKKVAKFSGFITAKPLSAPLQCPFCPSLTPPQSSLMAGRDAEP